MGNRHHDDRSRRAACRTRRLACGSALLALLSTAAEAPAAEVTVQNDSLVDFSQATLQLGFAAQERGAAWLTSPCSGDIVAVQVFWASAFGGAADTLGEAITISEEGTFPVPGSVLAQLVGPVMQDGFLNEFRFLDQGGTVPLQVPVTAGQTFVVDYRFLDAPPALGPSLATDVDGCQAGRNGIFAIPPSSWFSACVLGVSGDFVIRAVVDCDEGVGVIFTDGFESGTTDAWSLVTP